MSTQISWTDETWNPVTGCSRVSEGCRNCYAARQAPRLAAMGQKGYTALPWTARNAPENVMVHEDRLEKPLRWKKPRRVFVNSMSDLFHEQVPDEFILRVFTVMRAVSQHTFQILTKRPERMADFCQRLSWVSPTTKQRGEGARGWQAYLSAEGSDPLPNVELGTSVEDQRVADERIPHLRKTPAAVRFLSCEPLIGGVDLAVVEGYPLAIYREAETVTERFMPSGRTAIRKGRGLRKISRCPDIHWVIAGGESGPGFRPMDLDWARSLRDQCVKAGVPFFGKQDSGLRSETPLPPDLQIKEFPNVQ